MKKIPVWLYTFALVITLAVFASAWLASNYINSRKTAALQTEADTIANQILDLRTRSEILTTNVKAGGAVAATTTAAIIAGGLNDLQAKLAFMQDQVGAGNSALFRLARYYSLLEVKDYALEETLALQAKKTSATSSPIFILYFYPDASCYNCLAQEYILAAVKQQYAQAHVYSFDYDEDFLTVKNLIALPTMSATTTAPFLIVNGTFYPPFSNLNEMQAAIKRTTVMR